MAKKFICGDGKYLDLVGGRNDDTIALPVSFAVLPATIEVNGYTLTLKDKFHVSLVCVGKIIDKNNLSIPNFVDSVIEDFCSFTKHNNINLVKYRDEFKFVSENEKRSVVVMCDVTNLDKFYDVLNKKYNLNLEYPPTHVTLYTLQSNIGIFLTDSDDMTRLAKNITPPVRL